MTGLSTRSWYWIHGQYSAAHDTSSLSPTQLPNLVDYVKNIETLPQGTRDRLVGNHMKGVNLNQPITNELAKTQGTKAGISARSAAPPRVSTDSPPR